MTNFRADLHCHSTFSDGTCTPKELIALAQEIGLSGFSITDHDTVDAYHTAFKIAEEHNIDLIPGVEFSCMHKGHSVHILGYSFEMNNPAIDALCQRHAKRRINRCRAMLELLAREGMLISEQQLASLYPQGNIGRPHIALEMVKLGYVKTIEEAFNHYLGEGRVCYVRGDAVSVEETIDTIHRSKGLAVIAHPHLIKKGDVINDLLKMPFDGIEGYYALFNIGDNQRWIDAGKRKGWIVTGGSDFHGSIKPKIALGCSWVDEATFRILQTHYKKHG